MTKEDFIKVLGGHPRANDAIYWYCQAWHSGDDDLYKIMCSLDFTPRPWSDNPMIADRATGTLSRNPNYDPDLVYLLSRLDAAFVPLKQLPMQRVLLRNVKEGQVLTSAGAHFPCITPHWPSRVYRHHGVLGVQCSGGLHGVKLLPGSETTFHPLTENRNGYVVGFLR